MESQVVRRADAARNIQRIVDAAIRVFGVDPAAGMNQVAERAGLGRATLYRHFASREDLLAAIRAQARQEAVTAIENCPLDGGSSTERIERIVHEVIELGDRYRFISGWRGDADQHPEAGERIAAALRTVVERGQRRGELTRALPAQWAVTAVRSLVLAAIDELAEGRLTEREAKRLVTRVALRGLAPARRTPDAR
jgi:TetR/AcrR family transcriptional regulator, mexCD-oprJ operon repressor